MKTIEAIGEEMREMLKKSTEQHKKAISWVKDIKDNHLNHIEKDINNLKSDVHDLKSDMSNVKSDVAIIKQAVIKD